MKTAVEADLHAKAGVVHVPPPSPAEGFAALFPALFCEHCVSPNVSSVSSSVSGTWEINYAVIMPLPGRRLPCASHRAGNQVSVVECHLLSPAPGNRAQGCEEV